MKLKLELSVVTKGSSSGSPETGSYHLEQHLTYKSRCSINMLNELMKTSLELRVLAPGLSFGHTAYD